MWICSVQISAAIIEARYEAVMPRTLKFGCE
jgi:hypothetical protein